MDASVVGKFGMKGCGHRSSLPDSDGVRALGGENLHAFSHVGNFRRTDEDHFQGGLVTLAFEIADKLTLSDGAVDLASVGIAADADVERAKTVLSGVFNFFGEEDRTGAGAESWLGSYKIFQFVESSFAEEFQKCARFAARDDEAVDVVELLRLFDEHDFGAEFLEAAAVRVKITLQGQDSDDHWLKSVLRFG